MKKYERKHNKINKMFQKLLKAINITRRLIDQVTKLLLIIMLMVSRIGSLYTVIASGLSLCMIEYIAGWMFGEFKGF